MYRLIIKNGKLRGNRLRIDRGTVFLGRDPECHVQLTDDPEISRKHAIIERADEGVFIRDLGSLNQTLVNGDKIESRRLLSGDKVEIGDTKLVYEAIDSKRDGRRLSAPQMVTLAAVLLILVAEVGILINVPSLRERAVALASLDPSWNRIEDETVLEAATVVVAQDAPVVLPDAPVHVTDEEPAEEPIGELVEEVAPPVDDEDGQEVAMLQDGIEFRSEVEDAGSSDVSQMREEMEGLREQVQALATQQEEARTAQAESAEPLDSDPVIAKAKSMLKEALLEIDQHNLSKADDHLARIQFLAPDFVPAYVERARLFEMRAMLRQAEDQWTEVLNRTVGTPLYLEALAERTRLARTALIRNTVEQSQAKRKMGEKRLPRRIRLRKVEAQKFSKNDEFDEMRLMRVRLKPKSGEKNIDYEDAQVVIAFFDRDVKTGKIAPSRAVVPEDPIGVEGYWEENEEKTVTAAYILPQGFRLDEESEFGERMRYYGYVVRVYYRSELQDEDSSPKSLVNMDRVIEAAFRSLLKET